MFHVKAVLIKRDDYGFTSISVMARFNSANASTIICSIISITLKEISVRQSWFEFASQLILSRSESVVVMIIEMMEIHEIEIHDLGRDSSFLLDTGA